MTCKGLSYVVIKFISMAIIIIGPIIQTKGMMLDKKQLKEEDIKVTMSRQTKPELIDLEEEELDEEDLEEPEQLEELSNHTYTQSVLSTQTQKRGAAFRQKVEKYLVENRQSIPNGMDRLGLEEEEGRDGKLMAELNDIHLNQKYTEEVEHFILMFNKKPQNAINDYVMKGFIHEDTPEAIAAYIIKMEGIDKAVLGEYFGKNDKKMMAILHAFCLQLNFKHQEFDIALRTLLSKFRLPGEAQQIERVIWQFAQAFYESNQQSYDNADELFPLAYAIIMLSTDAHNPKQENKMTKEQFITNTRRPCPSISESYLSHIYDRITKEKFETETDYFGVIYGRLKDLAVSNLGDAIEISKELIKGDIFLKACWSSNKFVQRKVFLSDDETKIMWIKDPAEDQDPRFIEIKDITDITLGLGSAVMRKNKVPKQFDSLCFTITTPHRTLDLKARTTKQRGKWINYLRAILVQRRQEKRRHLQELYNSTVHSEIIQDMWNTDIFPFWDRHWDYKHRKPKQKGYIARGIQAICSCWSEEKKTEDLMDKSTHSGLNIRGNVLESLWKHGLPPSSRKTLWPLVIGNNLSLNSILIEDLRKRKKRIQEFDRFQMDKRVVEIAEILITLRPDLPPVRDLLLISQIFYGVFPKQNPNQAINQLSNLIHNHHFLSFYKGVAGDIDLRIQLFEHLMQVNTPAVKHHFKGIRLETRMFLVTWFLSVFTSCFEGEFLLRIWDNFVLQGQLYLFMVGITLIKYYEIQLTMCTFNEGLKMLKLPQNTSPVLFFNILQEQIKIDESDYEEYIQKRKHAIIKTKVQSIPLQ